MNQHSYRQRWLASSPAERRPITLRRVWVGLLLAILAGGWLAASTPAHAAQAASLRITAPARAEVGEAITFELTLRHANNVAGYESVILFDPAAAEFAGASQRQNGVRAFGRGVEPVAAVDLSGGAAVGFYSCPVANCLDGSGARQPRGAAGTVRLARVSLLPLQAGALEVRFDSVRVVDVQGNPQPVTVSNPSITIQVGPAGAGPALAAPGTMWQLPAQSAPSQRPAKDVTGDALIAYADLAEIAIAWQTTRLTGNPCALGEAAALDLTGDGCLEIGDIQRAAGLLGLTIQGAGNRGLATANSDSAFATSAVAQGAAGAIFTVNSNGD
jgi:hypothetical protein